MGITISSRRSRNAVHRLTAGTAMLVLLALAGPALAQQSLPSAAEPRRPDLAPTLPPAAPSQGGIEIAPAPGSAPVAGAATMPLTLNRVVIEGAGVFGPGAFDDLTRGITGRPITLADLFTTADAITARYREAGWVLTRAVVPAQRISDGTATIRIVEGFIARTVVEGDAGPHKDRIQAYLDRLTAAKQPVNIHDLERQLLLANDLPGVRARAVLSPAPGQTGGSVLTVKLEHDPVQAYASIDNRGSEYTGPWRLLAGAVFNGASDGGRFLISGVTALRDTDDQQGLTLGFDQLVGTEGTLLGIRAGVQRGQPGYTLAPLDVSTRANSLSLHAAHPLLRSRAETLVLEGEFSAYETRTNFFGQRFAADTVRTLSLGADFRSVDRAGGSNHLALRVVRGLDVFNATSDTAPNKSRAAGSAEFTRMALDAERVQVISGPFTARIALSAQIADKALLASEEFKLGGATFGRGFDDGELSGDEGVAGSLELRYAVPLSVGPTLQLYGFYDHGKVWNDDPVTLLDGVELASVGGGLRANLTDNLSADLQVAKPLRRDVATKGDRAARFFAAFTARF
ncbi:ShlB/FhaC/HecB family hemolysin secretion/activation protein [Niveispirillum sp. BGYR6]|uniref:ShlB/FhaC/HecB family hemolysin secretion/activation protein n=1 Tax=Niveispirillum sp. BGYR6 TaxID=2971249 RepID=UPI0022B9A37A|nr:ShlB/FhaC/HecB family hemolysin secretion/activation protein [Niveispirillum sp. BGYR6]MDG5497965.1 ShlB/FhaC/HecB family hemolysin secretion/activation protein [Niveispirillum sp. BGYR6]